MAVVAYKNRLVSSYKLKIKLYLLTYCSFICFLLLISKITGTNAKKCLSDKVESNFTEGYPEVHISKLIPPAIARNILENEKPSGISSLVNWSKDTNGTLVIPSTLDTLQFQCSAKYRVQWGFESYPWITWDTWTGVERPIDKNGTDLYTATVEFHRVQETSLQTRIPICHSVKNPCIQTALVPRSGRGSTVEISINNGSQFSIESKSEKELFGINQNCSLKFGYDPDSQKFYCQETNPNKSSSGKIFLRPCSDPVSCQSLVAPSNCSSETEITFPIIECSINNRCRMETALPGKFPGIAVCHSGNAAEHSTAIPYFFALAKANSSHNASNKTKRYLNWDDANPNQMIQIQRINDPIYTKEKINLACNASYFFLGSGMYFSLGNENEITTTITQTNDNDERGNDADSSQMITTDDDSSSEKQQQQVTNDELIDERNQLEGAKESVLYDEANIGGIGSKLPVIRTLELNDFVFDTPGRYEISCFAPVWNTSEWANDSFVFTVKDSIPPTFDGGNMTEKQYYAPNKRLECIAFGVPKPELSWVRDGSPVPSDIILTSGEQNQTLVWAFLTFPKAEYGIQGNFTCTATNVAGTVAKSIIIIPADKSSSTAIYILVGLVVLVTLLIPFILFLMWKVRRQKMFIEDLTPEEIDEFINGKPDYIPFHCDMSTYAYYLPYDEFYEVPRESLEIDFNRVLGVGEFGIVVYGLYKNANPPDGGPPIVKPVAVKTLKPEKNGKEYFKAHLSELKNMTYIGRHENIVSLIGACTENIKKREVYIATEYCENGSLLVYLRLNRYAYENPLAYAELASRHSVVSKTDEETSFINLLPDFNIVKDGSKNFLDNSGIVVSKDIQYVKMEDLGNIVVNQQYENMMNVSIQDLMKWSYHIACGMEYLASKKIIHGDLAARNVLLTRDLTAKIGDFGLSRQLYHYNYYTKTAKTPLPLKWLAPECLQTFQFSVQSDVWSYGITLFEIFSIGEIPYSSVQMNGEEFLRALMHGMRLNKPAFASNDVFELMMQCWKHDRKQRPTFADIVQFFQDKLSESKPTKTSSPE